MITLISRKKLVGYKIMTNTRFRLVALVEIIEVVDMCNKYLFLQNGKRLRLQYNID